MTRYDRAISELSRAGTAKMKCCGTSMMPVLKSGSLLTFSRCPSYEVDDIVFCRVRGRYIDAHRVVGKSADRGYLIANNQGHQNGWTKQVFGKVIGAVSP